MRAFLSDSRTREPRGHGHSWQDYDGVRSVVLLGAEACAEVSRILDVTEPVEYACAPKGKRNPIGPAVAHVALSDLHHVQTFPLCDGGNAHAALVQALEGFIGAGQVGEGA